LKSEFEVRFDELKVFAGWATAEFIDFDKFLVERVSSLDSIHADAFANSGLGAKKLSEFVFRDFDEDFVLALVESKFAFEFRKILDLLFKLFDVFFFLRFDLLFWLGGGFGGLFLGECHGGSAEDSREGDNGKEIAHSDLVILSQV